MLNPSANIKLQDGIEPGQIRHLAAVRSVYGLSAAENWRSQHHLAGASKIIHPSSKINLFSSQEPKISYAVMPNIELFDLERSHNVSVVDDDISYKAISVSVCS